MQADVAHPLSRPPAPERGFFTHHGCWAPGVRLFRRLSFRCKALIVSTMFVLPLAAVGSAYLRQALALQAAGERELAGAAFAGSALELATQVQQVRQLAAGGAVDEAAAKAPALLARLQALDEQRAALPFEVPADAVETVRANMQKAAQPGSSPLAAVKRQAQVIDVLQALVERTMEASGLATDPQLHTRLLIEVSLSALPQATEAALVQLALAGAAAGGAPVAMVAAQMSTPRAIALHLDARLRGATDTIAAVRPELAPQIAYAKSQEAIARAVDAVSGAGEAGWKADPAALAEHHRAVLEQSVGLRERALQSLQAELAERLHAAAFERNVIAALLVASLFVAAYLFVAFAKVMQGGLNEVRRHLRAMTEGDLTTTPRPWGRDEAAQLMLTLSEMQDALRGIVTQVRQASDGIGDASRRIAGHAGELTASTTNGAASLSRSTQAMERIGATVRATADGAGNASAMGQASADAAQRGGDVIGQVIATMQDIHAASKKIGEIIGAIDGIAFRTNILALNAAVEAARAGDSGRGFAVVAAEVRSLAQRSAQAAREIKTLVGDTLGRIDNGAAVVRRAGDVIVEVVESSQRVSTLLAAIAEDTRKQADDVVDVSRCVLEVDAATRQNVQRVEQTAHSAGELDEQARLLTAGVDRFQLPA